MSFQNSRKTFVILSIPQNEKCIKILTIVDAENISTKKFEGKKFMDEASYYLLKLKNLEGVFLDFFKHDDMDFLMKLRNYFVEFCHSKKILYHLISQDVLFTSMLLCHSNLDFEDAEKVYSIWIKGDQLVAFKIQNGNIMQINEIEIIGDYLPDKKFDVLLDSEKDPKYLVFGSQWTDIRLQKLKDQFQAQNIQIITSNFEECLKKSAKIFLGSLIHEKNFRWNLKFCYKFEFENETSELTDSTTFVNSLSVKSTDATLQKLVQDGNMVVEMKRNSSSSSKKSDPKKSKKKPKSCEKTIVKAPPKPSFNDSQDAEKLLALQKLHQLLVSLNELEDAFLRLNHRRLPIDQKVHSKKCRRNQNHNVSYICDCCYSKLRKKSYSSKALSNENSLNCVREICKILITYLILYALFLMFF